VAHHRDAGAHDALDHLRRTRRALQLDRLHAALGDQAAIAFFTASSAPAWYDPTACRDQVGALGAPADRSAVETNLVPW